VAKKKKKKKKSATKTSAGAPPPPAMPPPALPPPALPGPPTTPSEAPGPPPLLPPPALPGPPATANVRSRSPATKRGGGAAPMLALGEIPSDAHHQRLADADPRIAQCSTLILNEDYAEFEAKGTAHAVKFKQDVVAAQAKHLGVDAARIEIVSAEPEDGALKLLIAVLPAPTGAPKDAPAVAVLKKKLERGFADPTSALREKLPSFKEFKRVTISSTSQILIATQRKLAAARAAFARERAKWEGERKALKETHSENVTLATAPLERELERMGASRDKLEQEMVDMENRYRSQLEAGYVVVLFCVSDSSSLFISLPHGGGAVPTALCVQSFLARAHPPPRARASVAPDTSTDQRRICRT
jgi:hypothetical protein